MAVVDGWRLEHHPLFGGLVLLEAELHQAGGAALLVVLLLEGPSVFAGLGAVAMDANELLLDLFHQRKGLLVALVFGPTDRPATRLALVEAIHFRLETFRPIGLAHGGSQHLSRHLRCSSAVNWPTVPPMAVLGKSCDCPRRSNRDFDLSRQGTGRPPLAASAAS